MSKIKSNPSKTILTISTGLLLIFILTKTQWFLYSSLVIGLIGVFVEKLSYLIEKLWFKIANIIGHIAPNIILSVFYYLVLFPIAVLSKIFKTNQHFILKNEESSTYLKVKKVFDSKDLINPW